MARVLALVAEGFEEIELVTVVDVLRRGGVTIDLAAVASNSLWVKGGHQLVIQTDFLLEEVDPKNYNWLYLPGGSGGVDRLEKDVKVAEFLKNWQNKPIAAICAAPRVLAQQGLLAGRHATSYPSVREILLEKGAFYREEVVVEDNRGPAILTSRGPGTAMAFALYFLEKLMGKEVRQTVAEKMLVFSS